MTYIVVERVNADTWSFKTSKELLKFLNGPDFDDPARVAEEVMVFKGEPMYVYTKPKVYVCELEPGE